MSAAAVLGLGDFSSADPTPSLLTVIVDTNPHAWESLSLSFSKAVDNIIIFLNSHLAHNSSNQVAVIASQPRGASWLYPKPPPTPAADVEMQDNSSTARSVAAANKFMVFDYIESTISNSLREILNSFTDQDRAPSNTEMASALTLALSYTNKANIALLTSRGGADAASSALRSSTVTPHTLRARILVISVSDASPVQYNPTMNAIFAASHAGVMIDVLALRGDRFSPNTTFLQQAADMTHGTYNCIPVASISGSTGLLPHLMHGFADADARAALAVSIQDTVDFRAACFCHRKIISKGFVCSICLSIFCSVPSQEPKKTFVECPLCFSKLALGFYGEKPVVIPRRKLKKQKKGMEGSGREDSGSVVGTPF